MKRLSPEGGLAPVLSPLVEFAFVADSVDAGH